MAVREVEVEPGAPSLRGFLRGGIPQSLPTWDLLEPHDRKSGDDSFVPVFWHHFHNLALSGLPAGYLRDKPSECPRGTKYSELRSRRVASDRLHENRTTLTAIRHQPTPEVGTLARSQNCSPSTADEREVQKNDRVRRSKPNLDSVVGTQVAIHDPSIFDPSIFDPSISRDQPLLHGYPL